MRLEAFEPAYGAFFVPTFWIKVGGEDLVHKLLLTVTDVEVELTQKAQGRFSFKVASAFDWDSREFTARREGERVDLLSVFPFGVSVEIGIGYGDPSKVAAIIKGQITEVAAAFASGGTPELSVSGFDGLYPLTNGKTTDHWEDSRDSDVVRRIAAKHDLSAIVVQTAPVKERIDQNEENDLAFLIKLAERNKEATFYERLGELYFGPRRNESAPVAELAWGKGLLSFSPEANLAKQITEVEVHGWSAARGEPIVGRARRDDVGGREPRRESGPARVAKALAKTTVMSVRAAVRTQEEADARAQAILSERAQDFVTGTGECIGLPDILPDTNISLLDLGSRFSMTYYVTEATHKLDASGYRTTFRVTTERA